MTDRQPVANPYVGPRTFTYEQRHFFFGREREARDLLARVVSERVLLFYAQSGAGKSSLLYTRLIPRLREEEGFAVLPVGRVSGELPAGVTDVANIYLFNLMTSLDQSNHDPQRLAHLSLSRFLAHLTSDDGLHWYYAPSAAESDLEDTTALAGSAEAVAEELNALDDAATAEASVDASALLAPREQRYVLIIDQFEEIISSHAHSRRARETFFRQLNQALLDDPNLWVVLTMREDYVAPLDPYAHLMADKLRARFYMERMAVDAALDAVKRPAAKAERPFGVGVAEALVDNLRRVKIAGMEDEQLGHYVEPVQLQVVCYQLWENLQDDRMTGGQDDMRDDVTPSSGHPVIPSSGHPVIPSSGHPVIPSSGHPVIPSSGHPVISLQDLERAGDVDQALAKFYENALNQVLAQADGQHSELLLRNWFGKQLITEAGTRGLIFRGESHTGNIPNEAVDAIARTFLLRAELRSGGTWYELVHDRFITPILEANQRWLRTQPPLIRATQAWLEANRDTAYLLRGRLLREAERGLTEAADPLVLEFVATATALAESEQRHFWSSTTESDDRLPTFAHSYAVILRIADRSRLTGVTVTDGAQEQQLMALNDVLQTDHGYAVHWQQDEITLPWLAELFTELLPRELTDKDRLLIYITGPGLIRNDEWYLVPEESTADYTHELLSLTQLDQWIEALHCRHTLLVLDGIFPELPPHTNPFSADDETEHAPPLLVHQTQYDWYTARQAHQVIATVKRPSALPFATTFLAQLTADQDGTALAQLAPAAILTAQALARLILARLAGDEDTPSRTTAAVRSWNQARSNGGEYLFLLPNQEPSIAPSPALTHADNPYRGLEAYEGDDAQLFFGRARLTRELIAQVTARPLTVVLGASGTGKSSLVKAGLAPQLRSTMAADDYAWQVLSPIRPVNAPLQQLANLLATEPKDAPILDRAAQAEFESLTAVAEESSALFDAIAGWLGAHAQQRILLIVDQLEEVVTMCRREEERRAFIGLMARLLTEFPTQMRIVFTIRSDFEPHFAGSALGDALQADWRLARYVVTPMNRAELREVIERPAALHYLDFQPPTLVDQLIDEVEQTPGALSLLSFSLSELFLKYLERSEIAIQQGATTVHALTVTDYDELGGVIGSLSRRATALYNQLDAPHQATMERVMLRMVAVEGGELARRRVPSAELDYPLDAENERVGEVIAQMAATQLVLEGSDEAGVPYVEPAHDALVRSWDKLLVWKREAEDIIPLQRRLTQVANEWEQSQSNEKPRLLWHNDPRLALLQQVLIPVTPPTGLIDGIVQSVRTTLWPKTTITDEPTWLNRLETEFVRQSIVRRARNWQQISLLIVVVVITLATVAGVAEYNRQQATLAQGQAEVAREQAEVASTAAVRAEATAVIAKATAEADRDRATDAEAEARLSEADRAVLETIARSRQYAAQSTIELNRGQINLALLTALEARQALTLTNLGSLDDSQEAYAAIRAAVEQNQVVPRIYNDVGGDVLDVTWDGDERRALIRTDHGPVYVWDTETGSRFSVDSSILYASGQCSIRFPVWEAQWNQDATRFLTRGPSGIVWIWDASNGEEIARLAIGIGGQWNIRSTNDGCVYDYEKDGIVVQFDRIGGHDDDIWEVLWSDDEERLLVRMGDGTVRLWDIPTTRELVALRGHEGAVWGMQWSGDEQRVLTYGDDHTARIWNAESGEELQQLTGHTRAVVEAQWDQAEERVMTRSADGTVRIWDGVSGKELVRLDDGLFLAQATWSGDETRVLTYGGSVAHIWQVDQPDKPIRLTGHTAAILQATWSSDERRVLTRAADWTVRLWDAASGEELAQLTDHEGDIFQATWSGDEERVLTASNDGTARIWDLTSGTVISLTGHAGAVWEATWNSDESRLLTRGADDSVRIWTSKSGAELVRFTGHNGYVRAATWLADEERVLTYGNDNTVRIWYTDREELVANVCPQVNINMNLQEWARIVGAELYEPTCPNALLPDEVVTAIQEQITKSIQRGAPAAAWERATALERWLQQSGQQDKSLIPLVFRGYTNALQQLVRTGQLLEAQTVAEEFHAAQAAYAPPDAPPLPARVNIALILHDVGVALAQNENIEEATAQFSLAQEYGYPDALAPRADAQRIAGQQWLARARARVTTGDVAQVKAALTQAVTLDPTLTFDPTVRAEQMIGRLLLDQGSELAVAGDIAGATAKFTEAYALIEPGELSTSTDFVHRKIEPLLVAARRLLYAGDVDGALTQFAAHRTHVATVEQANRLAEASLTAVRTPPLNEALLLALEAKRLITALDAPTADERALSEQALWTVMAELGRTETPLPLILDRGTAAAIDWGDFWHATWGQQDQHILLHDSRGLVYLWDLQDKSIRSRYHNRITFPHTMNFGSHIWEALWNGDESQILIRGEDGNARLWDIETDAMREFYGHNDGVYQGDIWQATWSADERKILTRGSDGTARIWETATGQELARMEGHDGEVWQATWNSNETLVLTRSDDDTARIWEASSGQELVRFVGHSGDLWQATWNAAEDKVLTTAADGTARIWDAATGHELVRFGGHRGPQLVAAWSSDESKLLTNDSNSVHYWNATTGQEVSRFATEIGPLLTVAWSQDNERVLTRGADNTVRLWAPATGAEVLRLQGHAGAILQATWNRDESRILTTGVDGTARIWDSTSGRQLAMMVGHDGAVYAATWSPDEARVLTRGDDLTVRVWDATDGHEISRFVGHTERIQQATWSHDGTRLLTRSDDGSARIWYIDQAPLLALACRPADNNLSWATWSDLMSDQPYRLTCPQAPLPADVVTHLQREIHDLLAANATSDAVARSAQLSDLLATVGGNDPTTMQTLIRFLEEEVRALVRNGKSDDALTLYSAVPPLRRKVGIHQPTQRGEVFIALELMNIGTEQAKGGAIDEATLTFAAAKSWDPTLTVEPAQAARTIAAAGLLEKAHAAAEALALDDAIALYTEARDLDPALTLDPQSSAQTIGLAREQELGASAVAAGTISEAIIHYGAALALATALDAPETAALRSQVVDLLTAEARRLAQNGQEAEATARFAQALDYDPQLDIEPTTETQLWSAVADARTLLNYERYGDAMNQLYRVADLRPTLVMTETLDGAEFDRLCRQGSLLGEVRTVLPACHWALALEPMNAEYLDSYGIALALIDDVEGAAGAFEQALAVATTHGNFDGATQPITGTTTINSMTISNTATSRAIIERQQIWLQLLQADINPIAAYRLAAAGDLEAALAIYAEIDSFNPTGTLSAWEWNNLCWQGALHGHVFEVLNACGQAVALAPENANYRDSRGVARALIGDQQGAIEDFLAYMANPPADGTAMQRLSWINALHVGANPVRAHVATLTGDLPEAIAHYHEIQEILAADPATRTVSAVEWNALCWRGAQAGYAAAVLFACEEAVAAAPENGNYRDSRAMARILAGDFAGAAADLDAALAWAEATSADQDFVFKRKSVALALRALQLATGNTQPMQQWLAAASPTYFGRWAADPSTALSSVETVPLSATVPLSTASPISTGVAVAAEDVRTGSNTTPVTMSLAPPPDQRLSAPADADAETVALVETWNHYGALLTQIADEYELDLAVAVAVLQLVRTDQMPADHGRMYIYFDALQFSRNIDINLFSTHFAVDRENGEIARWRASMDQPWQEIHHSQEQEWAAFSFARSLDEQGAILALRMGITAMPAFNYNLVGYSSPEEMFAAFTTSEAEQIEVRYRLLTRTNERVLTNLMLRNFDQVSMLFYDQMRSIPAGSLRTMVNTVEQLFAEQNSLVSGSSAASSDAQLSANAPLTRTVRVGVMGRNTSDWADIDYTMLEEAKIEAVVLLSNINPRVFARIKREHPDTLIITRLYYPNSRTLRPNAQQFIETMIPVMTRLQPYSSHFQILNEPNHADGIEGWGSSDEDATQFNAWFLTVYAGLKAAHPWAELGFPALAVPDELHRDKAWLTLNEEAIQRADWLGIHSYWQTELTRGDSTLFAACCGLNFIYYHERYPDKVLHITEYGNANNDNTRMEVDEYLYAQEYVQWLSHLFHYPYIGSASSFILSSKDSSWYNYSWRTEAERVTAIVPAIGSMDRPPLVAPQPDAPITNPEPPLAPSEVAVQAAAQAVREAAETKSSTAVEPITETVPAPGTGPVDMADVAPEEIEVLNYEVQIDRTATDSAPAYWRAVSVRHLPPEENQGRRHLFVDIIDENGQPLRDETLQLDWGWEGQTPAETVNPLRFDRPRSEPAANLTMQLGASYWVKVSGDGLPSDMVRNLHTRHPDEPAATGERWNSLGHHSFHIVFQRTRQVLALPTAGLFPITQRFGDNPEQYSKFTFGGVALRGYNYVDFGMPSDTPVLATDDGKVLRVGAEEAGLGNYLLLSHGWGESLYAHLDEALVADGDRVNRGDIIGYSGMSGAAAGPHLAFGIRLHPYDRADGWGGFSDPLPYLGLE